MQCLFEERVPILEGFDEGRDCILPHHVVRRHCLEPLQSQVTHVPEKHEHVPLLVAEGLQLCPLLLLCPPRLQIDALDIDGHVHLLVAPLLVDVFASCAEAAEPPFKVAAEGRDLRLARGLLRSGGGDRCCA